MDGPVIVIQIFLLLFFILFLFILLYIILRKRKRLIVSVPLSLLFLGLITLAALTYRYYTSGEDIEAQKYLGDYKLRRLDGQECHHCIVRLTSDYRYTIIKEDKTVGCGKWWLRSAADIPGTFLQLQDGPKYVMRSDNRTIDYINRKNQ